MTTPSTSPHRTFPPVPKAAARLHQLLGLLPTPSFAVTTATALASLDHRGRRVREHLRALTDAGLYTQTGDRYRMPGDVHQDARARMETLSTSDRVEGIARLADHYVAALDATWPPLLPSEPRITPEFAYPHEVCPLDLGTAGAALRWLRLEHTAIIGIQGSAYEAKLYFLAAHLADTAWVVRLHCGVSDAWMASQQRGLDAARTCGHRRIEARLLVRQAGTLRELGRPHTALPSLYQALHMFQELDDHSGQSSTWRHIGLASRDTGDTDTARHAYKTAITSRPPHDTRGRAGDQACLALLENEANGLEAATPLLAAATHTAAGTPYEAVVRRMAAEVFYRHGHLHHALNELRHALPATDLGDPELMRREKGRIHHLHARAADKAGLKAEAAHHRRRAAALSKTDS